MKEGMKLSFSTNAFTRFSVFDAVEKIAAIGYPGVELLADTPHLYPPSMIDSDLYRLEDIIRQTGIRVANVNANTAMGYYGRPFWEPVFEPSLANPDASARKWRIDYTKRCIEIARAVHSPNVSITSGRMVPGTAPEESMNLLRASLDEVLDHAGKNGVRIGIEYEPGLLIECFEELGSLLQEFDSPHLGANLDLGHSHVLSEDPEVVIEGLSEKIFHIHIEDIRSRKHYHLVPGSGDVDFRRLFALLEESSYRGYATVELYTYPHEPEEAARRSLDYLEAQVY